MKSTTQEIQQRPIGISRPRLAGLVMPREHGAWAMWIVPGIVGAVLAGVNYQLSALFLTAVLLLFWARYPIWLWARSRAQGFPANALFLNLMAGLAGLALTAGLAAAHERWSLVGFGLAAALVMACHLRLVANRRERSIAAEFLGIAGLGLTGPATYYTATGVLSAQAALSWLLPALFFGTSVFSVKLRVEGFAHSKAGEKLGTLVAALVGYQCAVAAVILLLSYLGVMAPWLVVAYVPSMLQAAWLAHSVKTAPSLRRLGLSWVAQSVFFTLLLTLFI